MISRVALCVAALAIAASGCGRPPTSAAASSIFTLTPGISPNWPRTVGDAVDRLLEEMPQKDKETMRNADKDELIKFDNRWGPGIRHAFGLWEGGNKELMDEAKASQPDNASLAIIEAVRRRLRAENAVPTKTSKSGVEAITDEELILRWRSRKVTVAEVEATKDFPKASKEWAAFKAEMKEGDELWYFRSPGPTWENKMGWEGYAIFRGNKLVRALTTQEN